MKKAVLLLLLLAALGSNAAPELDCDGLNKTLPAKDLHKVGLHEPASDHI